MGAFRAVRAGLAQRIWEALFQWRGPEVRGPPRCGRGVFVGRDRLIARVLSTIHNNSILLTGEPGVGKTSILLELERRLRTIDDPSYRFFPVYIDLESTPEDRLFATAGDAILDEVGRMCPPGVRDERGQRGTDYGHRELACDLRRVVRALSSTSPRLVRLVLLIDGIDEVDAYHPRTTQRLRGLFMARVAENLVMVASAVGISRKWEREGSPWFNFFEEIELCGLSREDVERLVISLTRGRVKLGPGVIDRIAVATGGNPARIRSCCRALLQRLYGQNRRTIAASDVEALDKLGGIDDA